MPSPRTESLRLKWLMYTQSSVPFGGHKLAGCWQPKHGVLPDLGGSMPACCRPFAEGQPLLSQVFMPGPGQIGLQQTRTAKLTVHCSMPSGINWCQCVRLPQTAASSSHNLCYAFGSGLTDHIWGVASLDQQLTKFILQRESLRYEQGQSAAQSKQGRVPSLPVEHPLNGPQGGNNQQAVRAP